MPYLDLRVMLRISNNGDTAIASILIGLGAAVAGLAATFLFPDVAPRLWWGLFLLGVVAVVGGVLFLVDLHATRKLHRTVRFTIPFTFLTLMFMAAASVYYLMPSEKVSANLIFTHPPEIWMNQPVSVTADIENSRRHGVIIENISVVEIKTNSKLYAPADSLKLCLNANFLTYASMDTFNPKDTAPVQVDSGTQNISSHVIENVEMNGMPRGKGNIVIERGSIVGVSGTFGLFSNDWSKYNTVVLCPSFVVSDVESGRVSYMCIGIIDYRMALGELETVIALMPKDMLYSTVGHNNIGLGEVMAYRKDVTYSLDGDGGRNCVAKM